MTVQCTSSGSRQGPLAADATVIGRRFLHKAPAAASLRPVPTQSPVSAPWLLSPLTHLGYDACRRDAADGGVPLDHCAPRHRKVLRQPGGRGRGGELYAAGSCGST